MKHTIIDLPTKIKYKESEYPNPKRALDYNDVINDCVLLAEQLKGVDQIIGVARSGMPFATWIAQMLKIDLGYYNPKYSNTLTIVGSAKRIAFVDETSEWGHTQNSIRIEMLKYPQIEYVVGSVWIDMFHPQFNGFEAEDVVYGRKLESWITKYAGVEKEFDVNRIKFRK